MSEANALADRLFDTILDRYPVDAGMRGFDLDHESLVGHSVEADQRYRARLRDIGDAATRLVPENLSERITLGIVLHDVRTQSDVVDGLQIEFGISANIRTTVPGTLAFLPRLPVDTPERRAGYLERLRGLGGFFDTMITRHRKGFESGRTPVRHLVEQAVALLDGHLDNRDFLRNDALPLGRHTTEDLDPEVLHANGIRLIDALKWEFAQYGDDVFDRIRDDPAFRHSNGEEMLDAARKAVAKAEAAAPQWFRTVPDVPCVIKEAPPTVPAHVPPHYFPAVEDGSRPGTYFVNTKEPRNRLRIEDETTAYHEAVLSQGRLTLALLEEVVNEWIADA